MSAETLVIFDCDGVLVDSEPIAVRVDRLVLADLGWRMTEDEVARRFVGRSHAYFTSEIERRTGRELGADWDVAYQPLYEQALRDELGLVPGIVEALDALDLTTCVASNTPHRGIRLRLNPTGLLSAFDGRIFSGEDVAHPKPSPDLFELAAREMGRPPDRCVVVEDSVPGVTGAVAAGMRVAAYAGGFSAGEALALAGGVVFDDMRALPDLIRRLAR